VKLVVGLGNPGAAYEGSPHNVGFAAADVLAQRMGASFRESSRFRAAVAKGVLAGEPVAVMKPLTFMNASGEAVGAWMRWNRLTVADLVVVLDDVDLELGRLRIRQRGGSGGHKGLASVVLHAGSDAFVRVRLGVGRGMTAPGEDVVAHVLRPFRGAQLETATAMAGRAADAVEAMIEFGVERAMNRYNTVAAAGEKTE
jgi:peptidyl-tRNA hydrolase, PTH1 family